MTLTHKRIGRGGALLALALLPGAAHAGNLPSTATIEYGVGYLTDLIGTLNYTVTGSERTTAYPSTSNLYELSLTGAPFTATTVGTSGNPANPDTDIYDTSLYLFNSSGQGVLANDDDPTAPFSNAARSTITSNSLAPGLYYLAVSVFQYVPTSSGGLIFTDQTDPTVDRTLTYGPVGPGGAQPLSGWKNQGADLETGTFDVSLTGAAYVAVPESSSVLLLAAGGSVLLGLGVRRWKAKSA